MSSVYNKEPHFISSPKHMPTLGSLICDPKSFTNIAKRVGKKISPYVTPKGVPVSKHIWFQYKQLGYYSMSGFLI